MINKEFKKKLKLSLSESEEKLNNLFIKALGEWARKTPLGKGLPVGLPASAIVANMALVDFDRLIEQQVVPLYYGRYVDDIILVMENGVNFQSRDELWQWLFVRSYGKLSWVKEDEKKKGIKFNPDYLSDSQIRFANEKNKVFLLEGETGQTLINAIARQIHERASEWRALPNLPISASEIITDLVAATQQDGEKADNLRKTDVLTMRRAGFAIKLRDFEAYERDLPLDIWKEQRQAFFRAFCQHVLILPHFFELAIYLPRVVRLATACEEFESLLQITQQLDSLYNSVSEHCIPCISPIEIEKNSTEILKRWKENLRKVVNENIIAAFPPKLSKASQVAWKSFCAKFEKRVFDRIQEEQALLFSIDLAHQPFRFIGLPREMIIQRGIPAKKAIRTLQNPDSLLDSKIIDGVKTLTRWLRKTRWSKGQSITTGLPHGFLFATRPFNLPEIFLISDEPFNDKKHSELISVVLATRGFKLDSDKTPCLIDHHKVLYIPDGEKQKITITVSNWKTEYASWKASVMGMRDPDNHRYARLNQFVNSVISNPNESRYFILPELALPANWFMRIAPKLQRRGISLIAGIEYLHVSKSRVRNQVWAALSHEGPGFPSMMIYRQDKQRPALHEKQELQSLANLIFSPSRTWSAPLVIQHGNFRFALLVCSELTNIAYRTALRGQVDALFAPEWNQDTETFNTLVESAALDIHAFIIQCNNRQFGDSRIRAPYKESWRRDILRSKGGIADYHVVGKIDIEELRQFQSSNCSPNEPFKPVPDGFKINHSRRTLP